MEHQRSLAIQPQVAGHKARNTALAGFRQDVKRTNDPHPCMRVSFRGRQEYSDQIKPLAMDLIHGSTLVSTSYIAGPRACEKSLCINSLFATLETPGGPRRAP